MKFTVVDATTLMAVATWYATKSCIQFTAAARTLLNGSGCMIYGRTNA